MFIFLIHSAITIQVSNSKHLQTTNMIKKLNCVLGWVEKIVEKGFILRVIKSQDCLEKS